jgi:hypothetical protein
MRGNVTLGDWPKRVKSSERFNPNAFTRINTSPVRGVGIGTVSMRRTSGPPACLITTAFMFAIVRTSLRNPLSQRYSTAGDERYQAIARLARP